jgi:hypothetical protein
MAGKKLLESAADEIERMEDVGTQFAIEKGILQYDVERLRAALGRVCAVDKAAPGRRDCDIWAEMLAEAAEALRGEGSRDG